MFQWMFGLEELQRLRAELGTLKNPSEAKHRVEAGSTEIPWANPGDWNGRWDLIVYMYIFYKHFVRNKPRRKIKKIYTLQVCIYN